MFRKLYKFKNFTNLVIYDYNYTQKGSIESNIKQISVSNNIVFGIGYDNTIWKLEIKEGFGTIASGTEWKNIIKSDFQVK